MGVVRKQIFLEPRQAEALKRLARRSGTSEGALIRQAIDARLAQAEDADAQWEALLQRWAASPASGAGRDWRREDLYEERLTRHGDHPR